MIGLTICLMTMVGWAAPAKKKAPIKWPEAIHWVSFGEGQMQAATLGKPMLVLVYANWCTQCHALAKALADPKVVNTTICDGVADHGDSQGLTFYDWLCGFSSCDQMGVRLKCRAETHDTRIITMPTI